MRMEKLTEELEKYKESAQQYKLKAEQTEEEKLKIQKELQTRVDEIRSINEVKEAALKQLENWYVLKSGDGVAEEQKKQIQ